MLSEQQQRIMGYFIEEAKDHLNTIEQGLLNLQATIEDPEMVHEVFRAAHSVKGGAAMLGLTSIQLTAHRLEDYFKVLKECPLQIDQTLETLLLRVFDTLQELLEHLQGPFGLTDDKADAAMAAVEPVFTELNQHLNTLVSQSGGMPPEDVDLTAAAAAPPVPMARLSPASSPAEVSALRLLFQTDVPAQLREMLQLFKQPDTVETRQQLQELCRVLAQPGEQLDLPEWCDLLALVQLAIANPENGYRALAPVVIKNLKRAQEQVLAGQTEAVAASDQLMELLPADVLSSTSTDVTDSELAAFFSEIEADSERRDPANEAIAEGEPRTAADSFDFEALAPEGSAEDAAVNGMFDTLADSDSFDFSDFPEQSGEQDTVNASSQSDAWLDFDGLDDLEPQESSLFETSGPEVGMAELNSLADLFEGEEPNLGLDWQEEELLVESPSLLESFDASSEFPDLVFEDAAPPELGLTDDRADEEELVFEELAEDDLSGLLSSTPPLTAQAASSVEEDTPAESLDEWFGFEAAAEPDYDSLFSFSDPAEEAVSTGSEFENLDALFAGLEAGAEEPRIAVNDSSAAESADAADVDDFAALFGAAPEPELLSDNEQPFSEDIELPPDFLLDGTASDSFTDSFSFTDSPADSEAAPPSEAAWDEDVLTTDPWGTATDAPVAAADLDLNFEDALDMPSTGAPFASFNGDTDVFSLQPEPAEPELALPELGSEAFAGSELEDLFAGDGPLEPLVAFPIDDSVDFFAEPTLDLPTVDFSELEGSGSNSTAEQDFPADFDELLSHGSSAEPATEASLDWVSLSEEALPELTDLPITAGALDSSELEHSDELGELESSGPSTEDALELTELAELEPAPEAESTELTSLQLESDEFDSGESDSLDLEFPNLVEPESTPLELNDWSDPFLVSPDSVPAESIAELENLLDADLPLDYSGPADETDITSNSAFQDCSFDELNELENLELDAPSAAPGDPDVTFDELDAMLAEDGLSETESSNSPIDTSLSAAESDDLSEPLLADAIDDDFADLEALLDDTPISSVPLTETTSINSDDEFDDLEALLKDADQTLGVGSSPMRNPAGSGSRRSGRRGGLNEQTMRVTVKHLDNLNNLVGEMVVNRNSLEQAQERLRQFLDNLLYQVQQLSDVGQRMRDLYERSLLESSLLSSRRNYSSPQGGTSSAAQSSHATGVSFDALEMDRFTGFHTLSQEMIELIVRVRESASDIDFVVEESDQVTRNFRQITTQLQEGLTRSRMVPFAQTADRLPRGVRDNSLKYGKQAELVIEGRDTLIDKMIVEQLYDPMTHLVNNAIAHGIETPEERIAAGKSPSGRITIRAFHQGNQTVISVSDDGAGINPEKVRAKALAKGLISTEAARNLSRLDTYDLLFHHGFSTVDQVDDLRGRGVGLDVVRSNLNEIRGTISIDSAVGKGTTFTIRLPLTLSISKALCCISNRARIAFPMDGVEDMLDVPKERIQTDEQGRSCIQWRDMLLPFQPLSELLRYNRTLGRGSVYGGNQEEDVISIVVLRSAGNFLALQVDQVLGEQEIVIKQFEGPVPKPLGVAGATVLGDGRIMPIADVLELIDLWQGRIRREAGTSLWDNGDPLPPDSAVKTEPTVLIVDDSITVRELLSMTFSKVGYRVEQARDGQEAWEKLRSGLPCDLVFCDIEMPRMDGLELLARLQKDAHLSHLPIAMLTSRGADRHRQMAVQLGAKGYFTKPYLEEVLLDAAQRMLKGEVLVSAEG